MAFMDAHCEQLHADDLLVAAQALSDLADTEEFQTYEDDFLPGAAADAVARMRAKMLEPYLDDYDQRKTIQPLLRLIQDCGYK